MKIRTMLMISAMLFAILPMVIYTVFANTLLSSDGDKQFRDTLLEVAENERYTLQTYLDTVDKQAETILKNTEVPGRDQEPENHGLCRKLPCAVCKRES